MMSHVEYILRMKRASLYMPKLLEVSAFIVLKFDLPDIVFDDDAHDAIRLGASARFSMPCTGTDAHLVPAHPRLIKGSRMAR